MQHLSQTEHLSFPSRNSDIAPNTPFLLINLRINADWWTAERSHNRSSSRPPRPTFRLRFLCHQGPWQLKSEHVGGCLAAL